jgi:hypothetical protein
MSLFGGPELQEFADKLSAQLAQRLPPSSGSTTTAPKVAKALEHVALSAQEFRRTHKMNVVKQVRLSKAFQEKLVTLGYDDEFIKAATLRLAQSLTSR